MKQILILSITLMVGFALHAQEGQDHGRFKENFKKATSKYFRYGSTGTKSDLKWKLGVRSSIEPKTTIMSFKLDPNDSAGAGRGPEIISNDFTHFGTYSARLKVPNVKEVQPNVGAVVGYFTYHVDSVPGLSEIDFEWLIADPTIIYVGTWTGKRGELKRVGRTINLAKGIIYNTIYRETKTGVKNTLTGQQNQPETVAAVDGYDASSRFYTYGFDWYPDRITWWMIHPDNKQKIILWDYQGSQLGIPQNHSKYRMNFWHTNNWSVETNPKSLEKPLQPYELEVDWMSYKPLKK